MAKKLGRKKNGWKGFLFILPSLIGVMIFYIIPFVKSLVECFFSSDWVFIGLTRFEELLQNQAYLLSLKNTLRIILIALPLLLLLSLFVTLIIEQNLKKLKWVQTVLFIPLVLPAASMMLLWTDLFAKNGLINGILGTHVDWLQGPYAPYIIIGLILWKNVGYNVILMMSSLLSMPKTYEEAAALDGAGFMTIAFKIKVPYLVPVLFFTTIISLLNCFKIFREVYLLQGDYPNSNLYLLQHFMNNNFAHLNYDVLGASAFILYIVIFVIIYILSYLQQKYIQNIV